MQKYLEVDGLYAALLEAGDDRSVDEIDRGDAGVDATPVGAADCR